jgi:hypothetical protein
VANELAKGGLEKLPEALNPKNRRRDVTLDDGTIVVVEKWSVSKFQVLIGKAVGSWEHIPELARESVAEKDRERVGKMDPVDDRSDLVAIATAALEINLTPSMLKNLPSLIGIKSRLVQALTNEGQ